MDILHLVDRLESLLNKSWRIPFTANLIIDEDAFLDVIDQMRISIPEEVRQAERIRRERDRIVAQAQEEAERIVVLAREQAVRLTDEHETTQAAGVRAGTVVERARHEAEAIKVEADRYVIEVLSGLESQLNALLSTVRNGIVAVQARQTALGDHSSQEQPDNPGADDVGQG